jgi:hypothetical protein
MGSVPAPTERIATERSSAVRLNRAGSPEARHTPRRLQLTLFSPRPDRRLSYRARALWPSGWR